MHGGTAKHDTIDAHKMAGLLRGGRLPPADVYPAEMRATRDLVAAADVAHASTRGPADTCTKHSPSGPSARNRQEARLHGQPGEGVAERFPAPPAAVQQSIAVDLAWLNSYDHLLTTSFERSLGTTAKAHKRPRSSTACAQSQGVARVWPWCCGMQSMTASAFPGAGVRRPLAVWCHAPKHLLASGMEPRAPNLATPTSSGPSSRSRRPVLAGQSRRPQVSRALREKTWEGSSLDRPRPSLGAHGLRHVGGVIPCLLWTRSFNESRQRQRTSPTPHWTPKG